MSVQSDYGADDPIWVDEAWLDTVVVVGLTCFVLCLMNLSKVSAHHANDNCCSKNQAMLGYITYHHTDLT